MFTSVLISQFERDLDTGKDAEQKRRWIKALKEDPYSLFGMLGQGEQRQSNMRTIRNRTLRYLQTQHPEVDQQIAHVLITYCFVARENDKRVLLTWLSGQDVDESEAKLLGLETSWFKIDETSGNGSTQQQREDQALRAIRTIGVLSIYHQPIILAFDQLEGLRDHERLTQRWGDAVREIFTMTPNLLVVTCIFPSLWESWFTRTLGPAVTQRVAQQQLTLEKFGPQHGLKMLATHMEPSFINHRLPTTIYPFTEDDIAALCAKATSPRTFLQAARSMFEAWLFEDDDAIAQAISSPPVVVTRETTDNLIRTTLENANRSCLRAYEQAIPIEHDFFGRARTIVNTLLTHTGERVSYDQATCGTKVVPPNFIVSTDQGETLCLCVNNATGNSLTARMRNLVEDEKPR